jgi:NAD(P)-dependent dehydrogenase (short-subunit alcohol dehydrogenase family)
MASIFITGSADGLGLLTAKALITQGHKVVLHARNATRGREALVRVAGAETVVTADLTSTDETIQLSEKVNSLGRFDIIIHNAGVYNAPAKDLFTVNTLAPYILTCLIEKPKRLIYLSSDMHEGGSSKLGYFNKDCSNINYADTKLHVLILSKAVARRWPDVYSNAVNPGWVPTKMGGSGAPDDLKKGYETQVWLTVSNNEKANVSGCFFYHQRQMKSNPEADDVQIQERFLTVCKEVTDISFPPILSGVTCKTI